MTDQDPVQIYQTHLDTVSCLLWEGDFDGVCALMAFPGRIETVDATTTLHSPQELTTSLQSFRDSLLRQGTQAYHRICQSAAFDPEDGDLITGAHRTFALRGGTYVLTPWDSDMHLIRKDGGWRGVWLRVATRNVHANIISTQHPWHQPPEIGTAP